MLGGFLSSGLGLGSGGRGSILEWRRIFSSEVYKLSVIVFVSGEGIFVFGVD